MRVLDVVFVAAGLVLLVGGGEALVRGASALSTRAGIPSLVVGLIVVSAATSAPELAVTIGAVLGGEPDLAVGNVVGSNIANVLLILGVSALVLPLMIKRQLVRFDIPVMVGMSVLLLVVSLDGRIDVWDGVVLLGILILHSLVSVIIGRRGARTAAAAATAETSAPAVDTRDAPTEVDAPKVLALPLALVFVIVGVGLLVVGAQLLVAGAVSIATGLGVSSLVIGLTVVAIGTSLPELATSIVAVRRGERDLAVGNIVGSNIFNIGMVLGVPAILFGQGIPVPAQAVALDVPLMIAAAVTLLPFAITGFMIARWEGAVFVALYPAYTTYVILAATQNAALAGFSIVMLWFVLPLIAVAVIATIAFEVAAHRKVRD